MTRTADKPLRIILCLGGIKGAHFVESAVKLWPISCVILSSQPNVADDGRNSIMRICKSHSIKLVEDNNPRFTGFEPYDLCFAIGWRHLFAEYDKRIIVFHDSLLPRYRGYSPTVAALIAGDKRIGVTAFLPGDSLDSGPMLAQEGVDIQYPITIRDAFEKILPCYMRATEKIILATEHGKLDSLQTQQDEQLATYSLWRDHRDQFIDWKKDSAYNERFVNALGWPYTGARAIYDGQEVIIHSAHVIEDVNFVQRFPGKFWQLADNQPSVVCGTGVLKITKATFPDNKPVNFTRLRTRFE